MSFGVKKLVIDVSKELHAAIKLMACKRGLTIKELLMPLLEKIAEDAETTPSENSEERRRVSKNSKK
jgi:hypothetical protein